MRRNKETGECEPISKLKPPDKPDTPIKIAKPGRKSKRLKEQYKKVFPTEEYIKEQVMRWPRTVKEKKEIIDNELEVIEYKKMLLKSKFSPTLSELQKITEMQGDYQDMHYDIKFAHELYKKFPLSTVAMANWADYLFVAIGTDGYFIINHFGGKSEYISHAYNFLKSLQDNRVPQDSMIPWNVIADSMVEIEAFRGSEIEQFRKYIKKMKDPNLECKYYDEDDNRSRSYFPIHCTEVWMKINQYESSEESEPTEDQPFIKKRKREESEEMEESESYSIKSTKKRKRCPKGTRRHPETDKCVKTPTDKKLRTKWDNALYYKRHKTKAIACSKKWSQAHCDRISELGKIRYQKKKDIYKERNRKAYLKRKALKEKEKKKAEKKRARNEDEDFDTLSEETKILQPPTKNRRVKLATSTKIVPPMFGDSSTMSSF